jgi:RNA polymerase-interacting CarD/CdnL/TRCF family regulator
MNNGSVMSLWFSIAKATIRIEHKVAKRQLRAPIDLTQAEQVLSIMAEPPDPTPKIAWVRRMRDYKERIRNGLPEEIATIYRDLGRRPILSYMERMTFEKVRELLFQELHLHFSDAGRRMKEAAGAVR